MAIIILKYYELPCYGAGKSFKCCYYYYHWPLVAVFAGLSKIFFFFINGQSLYSHTMEQSEDKNLWCKLESE